MHSVCVCVCVFHTVPMRSDIPVCDFPDYVQEMTKENSFKRSKLAIEYQVNSYYHIIQTTDSYCNICVNFSYAATSQCPHIFL